MSTRSVEERLLAFVEPQGDCWVWTGSRNPGGYGRFNYQGTNWLAHRASYTILVGPIPDGLPLDHLCRNRACINPEHLDPVPLRVNVLRGEGLAAQLARRELCPKGHPFSERVERGRHHGRRCRICQLDYFREYNRTRR